MIFFKKSKVEYLRKGLILHPKPWKMNKIVKTFPLIIVALFISLLCNGQIKKDTPTDKNNFTSTFDDKKTPPPKSVTPGPGYESPITGGLGFLIIGSFLFWGRKVKQELSDE